MITVRGGWTEGLDISRWLKTQGLELDRDYRWYRRTNENGLPYECVVFEFRDQKWETFMRLKWPCDT